MVQTGSAGTIWRATVLVVIGRLEKLYATIMAMMMVVANRLKNNIVAAAVGMMVTVRMMVGVRMMVVVGMTRMMR